MFKMLSTSIHLLKSQSVVNDTQSLMNKPKQHNSYCANGKKTRKKDTYSDVNIIFWLHAEHVRIQIWDTREQ